MIRKPEGVVTWVPPAGPLDTCKIAIIGEQPGKSEIFHRPRPMPFVGPAGRELDSCMQSAGIQRENVYLTNVIKDLDAPLASYISLGKKTPVISDKGQAYINLLREELLECSANVLIPTGNIPLFALCARTGITKWRGSIIESTLLPGRKVIPTIHPATVIPPKCQYLNKHLIVMDLKRAKEQSEFPQIIYKQRNVYIQPSFAEVVSFLDICETVGRKGGIIDYDIEIYNEQVSCISFAYSPTEIMSIPFVDQNGDYFDPIQESFIWGRVGVILEAKDIWKRGQNLSFDSHFLLRTLGIHVHSVHDTMVAQNTLFPDYPKGLNFICTMYTDIPYYKDEGKKWFKIGGSWRTLWQYNATDSAVCAEAGPNQDVDLERQGNLEAYERQRKIIEPLVYMQERGIRVDVEGMKKMGEDYARKIDETTDQLRKAVGYDINPNSPKQLADYFYSKRGLPAYRKRGGGVTTDDTALKRLTRKGIREATLVRQIREYAKAHSNYLNTEKVDLDGRIRCSYNPAGTRFSRISSSENIFGTGMNMQNWPHALLKFLLFDEGYVGYTVDLSQAENRQVAYIGQVVKMIEAFETGKDVHRLTASMLFMKPYDEISDEPGSAIIGGGHHSERFWGKKSNHSLNYDIGYKTFALVNEIQENQASWIIDHYHMGYPEIRNNFHAGVKRQLAKDRTLTNLMGRKTLFLDAWDDSLWKAGYSCIPQGTTGDIINERGLNYIYYNQDVFEPVELLTQTHDSISFQIPLSTSWEVHSTILNLIEGSLETPLEVHGRKFVIPADFVMGLNFCKDNGVELKELDAESLKGAYETLCQTRNETSQTG